MLQPLVKFVDSVAKFTTSKETKKRCKLQRLTSYFRRWLLTLCRTQGKTSLGGGEFVPTVLNEY